MDSFSMVAANVTANGSYQFKIDHSKTKDMNIGNWITSPTFRVGRHDWAIWYYPQGFNKDDKGKYVSLFLQLQGGSKDVAVKYGFVLFDKYGHNSSISLRESSQTFTPLRSAWGYSRFLEITELEKTYVKDGYFAFQVSVTVKDESYTETGRRTNPIDFSHKRLQEFREENICTDVTFDVDGKTFAAHRLILAIHSPVFKAELFGSMAESNMDCITIKEMLPSVFKAMLDFMYNGSLSIKGSQNDGEMHKPSASFHQYLLAAADRYAVEELKTICEQKLIESISLDTVLSSLELAEKHGCRELKKKCLKFVLAKDNLFSLVLTEEYIKLMQNYPSLLTDIRAYISIYA